MPARAQRVSSAPPDGPSSVDVTDDDDLAGDDDDAGMTRVGAPVLCAEVVEGAALGGGAGGCDGLTGGGGGGGSCGGVPVSPASAGGAARATTAKTTAVRNRPRARLDMAAVV
jgi:hypothetical protein